MINDGWDGNTFLSTVSFRKRPGVFLSRSTGDWGQQLCGTIALFRFLSKSALDGSVWDSPSPLWLSENTVPKFLLNRDSILPGRQNVCIWKMKHWIYDITPGSEKMDNSMILSVRATRYLILEVIHCMVDHTLLYEFLILRFWQKLDLRSHLLHALPDLEKLWMASLE